MKYTKRILGLLLPLCLLLPAVCMADVTGYTVTTGQQVVVEIITTADVTDVRLMVKDQPVAATVTCENASGGVRWMLTLTGRYAAGTECSISLCDVNGLWNTTDDLLLLPAASAAVGNDANAFAPVGEARDSMDANGLFPDFDPDADIQLTDVNPGFSSPTIQAANSNWSSDAFTPAAATIRNAELAIPAYTGPGDAFLSTESLAAVGTARIDVLFSEQFQGRNWLYAEIENEDGSLRRAYFPADQLLSQSSTGRTFIASDALLTQSVSLCSGPSAEYDILTDRSGQQINLPAGQNLLILHEESGYFFVEFTYQGQMARGWIPATFTSDDGLVVITR